MTLNEFKKMRDELLVIFTPQELVRMVNLISFDGNIELMKSQVAIASKEDSLNRVLNAKLEQLYGDLPEEKLKKVSAYIYKNVGEKGNIYAYIPLSKED